MKKFLNDKKARITLLSIFVLGVFLIFILNSVSSIQQRFEYYNDTPVDSTSIGGTEWRSQSFTIGNVGTNVSFTITTISFFGYKEGSPGTLTAEIQGATGDQPNGTTLSSGTLAEGSISALSDWNNISMSAYTLQAGVKYTLVLKAPSGDGVGNRVVWRQVFPSAGYTGGDDAYSGNSGGSWTVESGVDVLFEIWGEIPDTNSPTYSNNQSNSSIAGQTTLFSLLVNDSNSLNPNGRYIFSTNNSGSWVNDSAVNFTATPSWANVTKTLNSTGNLAIGYQWYLTDNATNANNTPIYILTTSDTTPPSLTVNSPLNQTYKTSTVIFNVTATDATSVSACVYSLDSGVSNHTLTNTVGNFWTTTNSTMANGFYNVTFFCADSGSNWNSTSLRYFTVDLEPIISWVNPTPSDGGTVNTTYVYLNATISDFSETSSWIDWNNSLVGYWGFDYYNSTGVYDNSSHDNFGLFKGMDTSDLVSGKRGNAADFAGIDGGIAGSTNITIADDNSLDVTGGVTLAAWVKIHSRNTTRGYSRIISKEYNDAVWSDDSYMLLLDGNDEKAYMRIYLNDSVSNPYSGYSSSVIPLETWTFLVGTYNGSRITIYSNGVAENYTDGIFGDINKSTVPITLGNNLNGIQPINASIDEVMIFNRALSTTEIQSLYNSSQYGLKNNFTVSDETTYHYQAYSIDSVGNLNVDDNRSVLVNTSSTDTTAPAVYVSSPVSGTTYAVSSVELSVSTNENSTCYYILNGSSTNYLMTANSTGTGHSKTATFSNGAYIATFNCSDISGNLNNTKTTTFRVNVVESVVSPSGSSGSSSSTTAALPYSLDATSISLDVGVGTTRSYRIVVSNDGDNILNLSVREKNLGSRIIIQEDYVQVSPGEEKEIEFIFVGLNQTGVFTGTIYIGTRAVPVSLNVKDLVLLFDSNIVVLNKAYIIRQGDKLKTSVELIPQGDPARLDVTLNYAVKDYNDNVYLTRSESVLVEDRVKFDRDFDTGILPPGKYVIALELIYPNGVAPSSAHFEVIEWIPTTIFGKIVFYIINAVLIILIAIIGLVISNVISGMRKRD